MYDSCLDFRLHSNVRMHLYLYVQRTAYTLHNYHHSQSIYYGGHDGRRYAFVLFIFLFFNIFFHSPCHATHQSLREWKRENAFNCICHKYCILQQHSTIHTHTTHTHTSTHPCRILCDFVYVVQSKIQFHVSWTRIVFALATS